MTNTSKSLLLAALFIPGAALAQIGVGDVLGTSEADVRAALEAKGYQVMEVEIEDDEIEVEAMLDGLEFEFEIAVDTGAITEVELEDDDDDDDA